MGEFSIWHWLIVLAVVLLLFGSGKASILMGDLASGIKAFKRNMADHADEQEPPLLGGPEPIPVPFRVRSRGPGEPLPG